MTAPLPPILVTYDMPETDAERRDRIKRGDAARTYSFMVCSITSGRSDSAEIDEKEIK